MSGREQRVTEQKELWNRRAKKDGFVTVMCSDFSEEEANLADEAQRTVISRLLKNTPIGNRGLELGSGYGRLSTTWLEYVTVLIATDISMGMLKKLPKQPNIYPILADLTTLPLKSNSTDRIFISNMLGHLKEDADLLLAISEVNRVSTPSSLLFVDEMVGQEGELVAGHYKIRNPGTLLDFLNSWSIVGREFYYFGRQPHVATTYKRLNHPVKS